MLTLGYGREIFEVIGTDPNAATLKGADVLQQRRKRALSSATSRIAGLPALLALERSIVTSCHCRCAPVP